MTVILQPTQLLRVMEDLRPMQPFISRTFFPSVHRSDTQDVIIEMQNGTRTAAPYVMPKVSARAIDKGGYFQRSIRPTYVQDMCTICPTDTLTRQFGESLIGSLTPQQRLAALRTQAQILFAQRLDTTIEIQAVQALRTGMLEITGYDQYPDTTIDYKRLTTLDVDVGNASGGLFAPDGTTQASYWTNVNSNPMDNIEDVAQRMTEAPFGAAPTDAVMTLDVWKLLRRHQDVVDLINTEVVQMNSTNIDIGPLNGIDNVQFVGTINGWLRCWVSSQWYEDNDGAVTRLFPGKELILVNGQALQGHQLFGAIMNINGLAPVKQYFSSWECNNPSGISLKAESAPLAAPFAPNASARMTVMA